MNYPSLVAWAPAIFLPILVACVPAPVESSSDESNTAQTQEALSIAVQQAKLQTKSALFNGGFGKQVALSGDIAALQQLPGPQVPGMGEVQVFVRTGNNWQFETQLFAPKFDPFSSFGSALAIQNERLVIGSPLVEPEEVSVVVLERQGGAWPVMGVLVPENGLATTDYGTAVALSGDTILAGDPGNGNVYVFVNSLSGWTQQAHLPAPPQDPSDSTPLARFGQRVALNADRAVIAAEKHLFITERQSGMWSLPKLIQIPAAKIESVAMSGDTVVACQPYFIHCRVYKWVNFNLQVEQDIYPPEQLWPQHFGISISLENDRILIGTGADDINGPTSGIAYLFKRNAEGWVHEAYVSASNGLPNGAYSASVALSGDTLLIGSPLEDGIELTEGAAYVYTLAPGLPNGSPCESLLSCDSGICTDGVCCDQLCSGTCVACTAQKKGFGVDGTCEPIAAGTDPENECTALPTQPCGPLGACSGQGTCETPPNGGPCDDGDLCTQNDRCQDGACLGVLITCKAPNACFSAGQCQPDTGECEYPPNETDAPECLEVTGCTCRLSQRGNDQSTHALWMWMMALPLVRRRFKRLRSQAW